MTRAGEEPKDTPTTTARNSRTHFLTMTWESGVWTATVECPDRHLRADRPCAVWADDDGSTRENRCTFQQYAEEADLDEWLCARIEFQPIGIIEGGSGDDWHAVLADPLLVPPVVMREVAP